MNSLFLYQELDYVETYMEFSPIIRTYTKEYLVDKGMVTCYDDLVTITRTGHSFLAQFRDEQEISNIADTSGIDHNNIEMETLYE